METKAPQTAMERKHGHSGSVFRDTMNEILEARWQEKKGRGFWMCGCRTCIQKLADVQLGYIEESWMCGAEAHVAALLLLPGVDRRSEVNGMPCYAKTRRHAARQQHGRQEIETFEAVKAEVLMREEVNGRAIAYESAADWHDEKLLLLRRVPTPKAPNIITADKLPIVVICPRSGCGRQSIIPAVAIGKIAAKIARADSLWDFRPQWITTQA